MAEVARVFAVLCVFFLTSSALPKCNKTKDYVQQILPCDPNTRTRSVVYYLNTNCDGGHTPPVPKRGIPCDCPPGKGLSGDLKSSQQCVPCQNGSYGSGGEIISNWRDWTNNGTKPPEGSDMVTYCEISRDYVKVCRAWKASADNFTIDSGENSLSRCMTSVLLMTKMFVMRDSKVSFDYRVDSRDCKRPGYLGCDGLGFFIDSQQVLDYSGNQFQWTTRVYNLTKGTHTLKWIFRKRCYSYGYTYIDKAYIRSITLVGTVEPNVKCTPCPPGYYGNKQSASNCTACSYFQYQDKEGQQKCESCPPNTYAMLGASKCLPLPNCTDDDIIRAPGGINMCSCKSSSPCTTTVYPTYVTVKGFKGPRVLCNRQPDQKALGPETVQCRCQPGYEISNKDNKPRCQRCEKSYYSSGVQCKKCNPGHVALPGKHFYVWRNNTLPEGFTAQCAGDCSVKNGWISAGNVIRTERVLGNVHAVLQSPEFQVDSELARVVFNCSVICNLTGVPPKISRGEHLAKIQDCNLIFQVWTNNTVADQINCTSPKGRYSYRHEKKRDGENVVHIYPLKKGNYSFRWVFHQQDETRSLSTAFEAKVSNISVLGTTSGEARNCTPCPAGYRSTSGNTDCTICPNGTASSPGSEKCNPCKGETFATKKGSETCLPCGNNTKAFPAKDGCDSNGCKFTAAPDVEYDLSRLSRPGGPMIEVLPHQPGPPSKGRRDIIWPYRPALYVNLCTVNHDNSSCTYRDRDTGVKLPLPVMACRSSWYSVRAISLGSVMGYRAKDDVRSGLFVDLLHGGKCWTGRGRNWKAYKTTLDLRCDVKAGVGNPGPENNRTRLNPENCEYYLVWKSLYACPKCRPEDVTKITGECINGTRNVTYMRSVPCWGTGEDGENEVKTEKCVTPTVTNTVLAYREKKTNKVNKVLIGVGVVVILVLLGVAVFFVYKHRIMKYRYYTLMARDKPMSRLKQEDDDENDFIEDDYLAHSVGDPSVAIRT